MADKKPIISVEMQTGDWDKFLADFVDYREAVNEAPKEWKAVSDAIEEAAKSGQGLTEGAHVLREMSQTIDALRRELDGISLAQDRVAHGGTKTLSVFERMEKTAKSIGSTFGSVAKWFALGGAATAAAGLATGAGLYGLDLAGAGVYRDRRAAQGLGLDMANVDAFRQNFEPFVNSDALLSRVADARNDVGKQWIFRSLGLSGGEVAHENSAELSADVVRSVRQMIQGVPEQMLSSFAQARGIDQLFSLDELRRLRATPESSLDRAQGDFYYDRRRFAIPEDEQIAWVKFSRSLTEAGVLIDRSLIRGLAPLAPAFQHLSHSVADLIDDFLSGPVVKEAIDDFAGWLSSPEMKQDIEAFRNYIGSKGFAGDMQAFIHDFEQAFSGLLPDLEGAGRNLRTIIHFLAQPLPKEIDIFGMKIPIAPDVGKTGDDGPGFADSPFMHMFGGAGGWLRRHLGIPEANASTNSDDIRVAAIRDQLAHDLGISPEQAGGFLSAPYAESGLRGIEQRFGLQPGQPPDLGWAQWHGPRRAEFLAWAKEHGLDWHSDAANMGFMEYELQHDPAMLARLRAARTPEDAAAAGHQYESGGSDYFRAQHMANAERFAHLPSPVPKPDTAAPAHAPATGHVQHSENLSRSMDALRKTIAAVGPAGNRVRVNVTNDTAARLAISAQAGSFA